MILSITDFFDGSGEPSEIKASTASSLLFKINFIFKSFPQGFIQS
jgi:hypothetical protein